MRIETLPSPGMLSMGIELRNTMAKAISAVEISAGFGGGKSHAAKKLTDFLTASAAAIAGFLDVTAPTVVSRTIVLDRFGVANTLRIRHSEDLDAQYVPLPAAFTIAGVTKVISKVCVEGPDVLITVTVPWVTGNVSTVAYTQPGAATNLRDLSANLLATYTAAAITNPL